ncbi:MAG: ATP-dependent sacrificial sulfur transferase LarE [Anaerolineales bacterium]
MEDKERILREILASMRSVAVAYSGGVDSTYLIKIAHDVLGEGAVAITAVSASLPTAELAEAQQIALQVGIRHVLIDSHETQDPRYLENSPARCYYCKQEVFTELAHYARQNDFAWIADGCNWDDLDDHRPGRQAAQEHGVCSPLLEAELTKKEIRQLARRAGLPNWDKPAAACLSSRIPYGTLITIENLRQVEQAERFLRELGLRQVRVRHHDQTARIEVEIQDLDVVLSHREAILNQLQALGYTYVTLDLAGFRSGSLNAAIKPNGHHKNRGSA